MPSYEITDQTTHSLIEQKEGIDTVSSWTIPKIGIPFAVINGTFRMQLLGEEIKIPRALITVPASVSDIDLANQLAFISVFSSSGNTNWLGVLAAPPAPTGTAGDWFTSKVTGDGVYWDDIRGAWLGIDNLVFSFTRNVSLTNTGKMNFGDVLMTDGGSHTIRRGFPIPFDCVVTAVNINAQANTTNTSSVVIYADNDHSNPFYTISLAVGVVQFADNSVNEPLSAGQVVGIRLNKGGDTTGVLNQPHGTLTIKRLYV